MRKSLTIFSSIACNSVIASSKQTTRAQEPSRNLENKLNQVHEHSKSLYFVKPRTQCKPQNGQESYLGLLPYETMNENVNWMKLTHILSIFSLNPMHPSIHLPSRQHS